MEALAPAGNQYSTKALGKPKASAGLHTQTALRRCRNSSIGSWAKPTQKYAGSEVDGASKKAMQREFLLTAISGALPVQNKLLD